MEGWSVFFCRKMSLPPRSRADELGPGEDLEMYEVRTVYRFLLVL